MTLFTFLMRLAFPMIGGYSFLSIQMAWVVQYIIMLILGVVAYQRNWFRNISDEQGKLWLVIAILSIFFMTFVAFSAGAFEGDITLLTGGFIGKYSHMLYGNRFSVLE